MPERDITDLIERLEAFEDRLGVSLEGLFAKTSDRGYDRTHIHVNGELHLREGAELKENLEVVAIAYDSSGRVLDVEDIGFWADSFFGFEAFSLFMDVDDTQLTKIRVYPKVR